MDKEYKLLIINRATKKIHEPAVIEGVQWETERAGSAGKLTFTVVKTESLAFHEGDFVQFTYLNKEKASDGSMKPDFVGVVFQKHRNKNHHIEVTAYDQIRYLLNKSTYAFGDVRADQVLSRIVKDFGLLMGDVPNTGFVIEKFNKSDQTLLDMIGEAIDETKLGVKRRYCLYDDAGYLMLRDIDNYEPKVIITEGTAEDFDYTSSIDSDTYNQVVIIDTERKSGSERVILQDAENQDRWGHLTNYIVTSNVQNINEYAKNVLAEHNRVSRTLSITGQFGDISVRAGVRVFLRLYLGDIYVNWVMTVDRCTHTFNHGFHTMDLDLSGWEPYV